MAIGTKRMGKAHNYLCIKESKMWRAIDYPVIKSPGVLKEVYLALIIS